MIRKTGNHLTLWAIQALIAIAALISFIFGVLQPLISGFGWGRGPIFGSSVTLHANLNIPFVRPYTEPALPSIYERQERTNGIQPGDFIEMSLPNGVEIWVRDFDLRQGIGLMGGQTLAGAVIVASLVLLFLIVNSFRQGHGFTRTNTRRLLLTGLIVAVGGEIAALLFYWGTLQILNHPDIAPYVLQEADLSFTPLLVGAGVLLVAEVFRHGVNLQYDVDHTI
ncbi:DUF2975 domain-containing protein [Arthrobacter sp. CAN_C5]|uniref:DUF2975 domain-containing protein n=1 Tax=Arthrobacter sp. CAN_C5 TaxID=2760706 RepID=UPI001AE5A80B|nr:DUF2975 domain-containing protein [Arthrobacter sp. CAN_C5]MBP2216888.1 hypothetical protein [Arthrobacter sp. CAN_C5]